MVTLRLLLVIFCSICLSSTNCYRQKRAVWDKKLQIWSNKTVPYLFNVKFSQSGMFNFYEAVKTIEEETCVKFMEYNKTVHKNWLLIRKSTGKSQSCSSEVGMLGLGEQYMYLDETCRSYGLILHEIVHTLGLYHEVQRPDRDQYIKYLEENIQEIFKSNFQIDARNFEVPDKPFDFQSVTLYGFYSFSSNGLPVWLKQNASDNTPVYDNHQRDLSFWDSLAINELYQCADHCNKSIECKPPSYIDKKCQCQSIEDYAERRCRDNDKFEHFCKNATATDFCYKKPQVSSLVCRKTCGRCFTYGSFGNSKRPNYTCTNTNDEECESQKKYGGCFVDSWTKSNCRKTCELCDKYREELQVLEDIATQEINFTRCRDLYDRVLCKELAEKGDCLTNKVFMLSNCALSCNVCPENSTDNTTESQICRNYAMDSYCDVSAKQNRCNGKTLAICQGSCGKCGEYYEKNEIYEPQQYKQLKELWNMKCEDKQQDCEYYIRLGHCKTHSASMLYHCSKSCGVCDPLCVDTLSWDVCLAIQQQGLCATHRDWAHRCRKTCKLCQASQTLPTTSTCFDEDSAYMCNEVVRKHLCMKAAGCSKSCGFCSDKPGKNTVVRNITDSQDICKDLDLAVNCENLKQQKQCFNHIDRAVLCKKSCDLCPLPTTTSSVRSTVLPTTIAPKVCLDQLETRMCKQWSREGLCKESTDYMETYCAKTCGVCNKGAKGEKVCTDESSTQTCEQWKSVGYCYSEQVMELCKKTCKAC